MVKGAVPLGKTTVLIADDSLIIRDSISQMINSEPDMEAVYAAADGREAVEKTLELGPDLVLMDITMPNGGAMEAIPQIRSHIPEQKILVFSVCRDENTILDIFRRGARGFVSKSAQITEVFKAIRSVGNGEAVIPPRTAALLMQEFERKYAPELELTMEERRILSQVSDGMSSREVSYRLFIPESAVNKTLNRFLTILQIGVKAESETTGQSGH